MDDGEHLSGADDAVDIAVGRVEELSLLNGLLVIATLKQSGLMGLVEAVQLVPHVLSHAERVLLSDPLNVQIAPSIELDQVLGVFLLPPPP